MDSDRRGLWAWGIWRAGGAWKRGERRIARRVGGPVAIHRGIVDGSGKRARPPKGGRATLRLRAGGSFWFLVSGFWFLVPPRDRHCCGKLEPRFCETPKAQRGQTRNQKLETASHLSHFQPPLFPPPSPQPWMHKRFIVQIAARRPRARPRNVSIAARAWPPWPVHRVSA